MSRELAADEVEDPWGVPSVAHLRAGGTSLLLATDRRLLPRVLHWGADLGELSVDDLEALAVAASARAGAAPSRAEVALDASVLPEAGSGWVGRPGVEGRRAGRLVATGLRVREQYLTTRRDGAQRLVCHAVDDTVGVSAVVEVQMLPTGVLGLRATLADGRGRGAVPPFLLGAVRLVLPVPAEATEVLDVELAIARTTVRRRRPFAPGVHEPAPRRDGAVPQVLAAARPGDAGRGEVWAVRVEDAREQPAEGAGAGDETLGAGPRGRRYLYAERLPGGVRVLGGAEITARPGEDGAELAPGRTRTTPWLRAAHGRSPASVAARLRD